MKLLTVSLTLITYTISIAHDIEVRPAALHELPSILEFDEKVTYEFFIPLRTEVYKHLKINRDAEKDLQEELAADREIFPKLIIQQGPERLHIAWDREKKNVCGLLLFSQQKNNEIILDLLLVDKNYRRKGIGKSLIQSACQAFDNIKAIVVYPTQFNNDNTLKFYEGLGFKNCGVGPEEKRNHHGIRYSDIYYYFRLDVPGTE